MSNRLMLSFFPPSTQEAPSPFSFVPGTRASNVTTVALRRAAPEHPRGSPPPDFTTTAPNHGRARSIREALLKDPMPWRQQTGLHDNSAQPWREPDRPRRWQRRCSKSARCPGANKADYTTTTTDPGLDTSNQGGHARRRSGGRPKTSRPSGYQRATTGRRTNMERRMYRCDNMRVVCH